MYNRTKLLWVYLCITLLRCNRLQKQQLILVHSDLESIGARTMRANMLSPV
uniref:Uncharacterized protein n=1 Tax=Candidatus Methanogaster sp. ANME-2c ERB4 TaxID=2759911 RepID=A0A7G9YDV0_9EURY|nr:hypothetical protein NDLBFEBI_00006 [Methanosarcinales archaeon ANME-2c ERB4]